MPVYEYKAKSKDGSVISGRMEAVDDEAVNSSLMRREYYPVSVKLYNNAATVDLNKLKRVTVKDIAIFCRQFSVIINSGISIVKGLSIIRDQTENVKLKSVLSDVYENVQKGKSLSSAMGSHKEFPDMLINMIQVGEVSGTLDTIMERMSNYYDKEYRMNQKVKQALTYPLIICIFAIVVVTFLVIKVLPTFTDMLLNMGQTKLPLPTRIVMAFSSLIKNYGILLLIAIVAFYFVIKAYIKSPNGKRGWDSFKLKAALFGKLNKKIITSQFARTFGILIASGVPLVQSLSVCANAIGNDVFKDIINSSSDRIKKGASIADTLSATGFFPPMLTNMIKVGEESGNLEGVLEKTAEFYDGEVESATTQMTTMIEPIMIIILAVIVGFIIISIILPIFNMYNAVGNQ